jgi:hypothetical protein
MPPESHNTTTQHTLPRTTHHHPPPPLQEYVLAAADGAESAEELSDIVVAYAEPADEDAAIRECSAIWAAHMGDGDTSEVGGDGDGNGDGPVMLAKAVLLGGPHAAAAAVEGTGNVAGTAGGETRTGAGAEEGEGGGALGAAVAALEAQLLATQPGSKKQNARQKRQNRKNAARGGDAGAGGGGGGGGSSASRRVAQDSGASIAGLDDTDAYAIEWKEHLAQGKTGSEWGGYGHGGRGVARKYQCMSTASKGQ